MKEAQRRSREREYEARMRQLAQVPFYIPEERYTTAQARGGWTRLMKPRESRGETKEPDEKRPRWGE